MGDGQEPASIARGAAEEVFSAQQLRIAGPNCMGAFSYRERLFGYPTASSENFRPAARRRQSGSTLCLAASADRGLRFSYGITRQRGRSRLADYLNFLTTTPTPASSCCSSKASAARKPLHAAGRALAAGKPIIAIKTGATAKSQAAAQSHTGAIGGDYAAYLAMRALWHRQLPLAGRHAGSRVRLRRRATAEGPAHRFRHHLRHGRSAL
jgi:acyl-CoA synthetase (NDP forming)